MSNSENSGIQLVATLIVAALFIAAPATGCCNVEPAHAGKILRASGYTDVEFRDYAWWSCGGDALSLAFVAKSSSSGEWVQGAVCCGWLTKDCTVRLE